MMGDKRVAGQAMVFLCSAKVVMSPFSKVEMSPFDFCGGVNGRRGHYDEQEGADAI